MTTAIVLLTLLSAGIERTLDEWSTESAPIAAASPATAGRTVMPAARINPHVVAVCKEFPSAGNRTLAKALMQRAPLQFRTLDMARCAVRNYRGNHGPKSRQAAERRGTLRANRKPGEMPKLPESVYRAPEPFELDARKVLVISDLHLEFQANVAVEAALKHGDEFKPDTILLNGDLLDFYQLSRFDKDPTMPKVSSELEAGRKFWTHVRARFPRAKLVYKLGNHDTRFTSYIFQATPLLADIPGIRDGWEAPCGVRANKVTVVDDKRVVMAGNLPIYHGHELGGGIFSPVNPARGAFMKTNHTVMVSHHHQTSGHSHPNMFHDETFCWSIGCLANLSPRYAVTNKWNWGFATVTIRKGGDFDVSNLRITKDGTVRAS
jgi:predicted phosphodiesterase